MSTPPERRERFFTEFGGKALEDVAEKVISFLEEEMERAEKEGFLRGVEAAQEVARKARATFFVGKDYKPDEKVDQQVDEALYELRAEIVDGIALLSPQEDITK